MWFLRDLQEPTITGPAVRTRGRGAAAKRRGFGTGVTARCSAGAAVPARRWSRCDAGARRPKVAKTADHLDNLACTALNVIGTLETRRERLARLVRCGAHELTDDKRIRPASAPIDAPAGRCKAIVIRRR